MRITHLAPTGIAIVLALSACSAPETGTSAPTTLPTTSTVAATVAPTSTTAAPVAATTEPHFDARESGDVFAMVETWESGMAAGWSSPLLEVAVLPDDAESAVPDGRGGVVFTTNEQVWWMSDPAAQPAVLEEPGAPVQMVGLRHVEGDPVVLVRIGDKLIGYDRGVRDLGYLLDQFSGDIIRIDVDRNHAVAIVEGNRGLSVELMVLDTGATWELLPPVEADLPDAPRHVAVAGDRIVVLRAEAPALVLTTMGTYVAEFDLGIEAIPVRSIDLVEQSLLVGFGEAAIVTDIRTGERYVPNTLEGWVLDAVWAVLPVGDVPDLSTATRFRVNMEMVQADTADPFLNVRQGPSADHDITAKLPPTYTGLLRTGPEQETSDGALWYQVELLDPIYATPGEPLEGQAPVGWVNSAFLEPLPEGLPVTLEEVPGCVDVEAVSVATGEVPDHVYALESVLLSDRCLRVVLTFGEGNMPGWWGDEGGKDLRPATGIPDVFHSMSGTSGSYIDLGGVASVWSFATETDDDVYVVRSGRGLQLWMLQSVLWEAIHAIPERGIVVIDYTLDSVRDPYLAADHVILTRAVWGGSDGTTVTGITRPHEGNLGVTVVDTSGNPVEAVFSGSLAIGTTRTDHYAVQTQDWTEAWAPFVVQVEGLESGEYVIQLDPGGQWDTLEVPFTVEDRGTSGNPEWMEQFEGPPPLVTEAEHDIVEALITFARGEGSVSAVPLADEVTLGLNTVDFRSRSSNELSDPESWIGEVTEFDGFSGDFSALNVLARAGFVRITSGPIPHCAGPPLEWPPELDGLRQVNIEPIGGDSCMQWFGVSLLLNPDDEVRAVVLDLFGP